MREHRYMGELLKLLDKRDGNSKVNEMYLNGYFYEEKTYIIRSKRNDDLMGYIYIESIETHTPQMTMQFNKQIEFKEKDFMMIRDFLNWLNKEYHVRVIQAFVNSNIERELFSYLGYVHVEDEVMLALPV